MATANTAVSMHMCMYIHVYVPAYRHSYVAPFALVSISQRYKHLLNFQQRIHLVDLSCASDHCHDTVYLVQPLAHRRTDLCMTSPFRVNLIEAGTRGSTARSKSRTESLDASL